MNKSCLFLCFIMIVSFLRSTNIDYYTWNYSTNQFVYVSYNLDQTSEMGNADIARHHPNLNDEIYIRGSLYPYNLNLIDEYGQTTGTEHLISDSNYTPYYISNNIDYEQIDETVQEAVSRINNMFANNSSFIMGEMDYDDEGSIDNGFDVIMSFVYDSDNFPSDSENSLGCCESNKVYDSNGCYIYGSHIYINCTEDLLVPNPPLLDFKYWDISHDQPLEQDGYTEYYLITTIMHELLHAWGLGHINSQDAVMYPSQNGNFFSTITMYDLTGLGKLYDNSYCTPNSEGELLYQMSLLGSAYPNPFNPETSISYFLSGAIDKPEIEIYNLKSQIVRSYDLEEIEGKNSIVWNGKDSKGKAVGSGVYFYTLKNNGEILATRKMTLLK